MPQAWREGILPVLARYDAPDAHRVRLLAVIAGEREVLSIHFDGNLGHH
jgi:hypothetical protein